MDKELINRVDATTSRITMFYIWELVTEMAKHQGLDDVVKKQEDAFEHEKNSLFMVALKDLLTIPGGTDALRDAFSED